MYMINSNRSTGVSEPGFVYEQLVVGPLTIAICSNKNNLETVLSFGLDFFDQENSKLYKLRI